VLYEARRNEAARPRAERAKANGSSPLSVPPLALRIGGRRPSVRCHGAYARANGRALIAELEANLKRSETLAAKAQGGKAQSSKQSSQSSGKDS
jgi:hypothetical protein